MSPGDFRFRFSAKNEKCIFGWPVLCRLLQVVYCRSSVNAETGKVQQRLQFDGDDIIKFEDQLNELVY